MVVGRVKIILLALVFLLLQPAWALDEWWDHYERGEELAEKGEHEAAIEAYGNAISMDNHERKMARTYGVNFIEYYPSREMGISYYQLGNVEDGRRYLERSMKLSPSKRAREYLDRLELGEVPEAPKKMVLEEQAEQATVSQVELEPEEPAVQRNLSEEMMLDDAESLNVQLVDDQGKLVRSFRYKRQEKPELRLDSGEMSFDIVDEGGKRMESLSLRGGQRPVVRIEQDTSFLDIVDDKGQVLESRALRTGARSVLRSDQGAAWVVEILDNRGQVLETKTLRGGSRPDIRLSATELAGLDSTKLNYSIKATGRDGLLRETSGKFEELAALAAPKSVAKVEVSALESVAKTDWTWVLMRGAGGALCLAGGIALIVFGGRGIHSLTAGLPRGVLLRVFESIWEALAVVCGMMIIFMGVHLVMDVLGFPLLDIVLYYLE